MLHVLPESDQHSLLLVLFFCCCLVFFWLLLFFSPQIIIFWQIIPSVGNQNFCICCSWHSQTLHRTVWLSAIGRESGGKWVR